MNKTESISLRQQIQIYSKQGMKQSHIAELLKVSRKFVRRWAKIEEKNITEDKRGWKQGNKRKYNKQDEENIVKIRGKLEEDFFLERRLFNIKCLPKFL